MLLSAAILGLTLSWPVHLDWLKPHKAPPSQASVQRQSRRVRTDDYNHQGWQISIRRDGFTGQTHCRLYRLKTLRQGRVTYAQHTLGFELGAKIDASRAWYILDNGPAKRWQDLYPGLAAARVPLEGPGLLNPTGGVVLIPLDQLADARVVTIRADEKTSPQRFELKGLAEALAAARLKGCSDDESFEREAW